MKISVIDRESGNLFEEKVYGEKWLRFFFEVNWARLVISFEFVQKLVSKLYGFWEDSSFSKNKIPDFVSSYQIDLEKFVVHDGGYASFNQFFTRELKSKYKSFPVERESFGSPCEARLSVFKINKSRAALFIKQQEVDISDLVGPRFEVPESGFVWVFRLCPTDYHRFHFPDGGKVVKNTDIPGKLFSVNPISIERIPHVFLKNERHICEFDSQNFGKLFIVEVGAMCVGRIEQFVEEGRSVKRGDQKGLFRFGASTVVLISEKIVPAEDLLKNTSMEIETHVRVGEVLTSN